MCAIWVRCTALTGRFFPSSRRTQASNQTAASSSPIILDEFELGLIERRLPLRSHCETTGHYINWMFSCHAPDRRMNCVLAYCPIQPLQIGGCFWEKQKDHTNEKDAAGRGLSASGRYC